MSIQEHVHGSKKITTIINDGRLIGYIKLPEDILNMLVDDKHVIVLHRQLNSGDSKIVTFELAIMKMP